MELKVLRSWKKLIFKKIKQCSQSQNKLWRGGCHSSVPAIGWMERDMGRDVRHRSSTVFCEWGRKRVTADSSSVSQICLPVSCHLHGHEGAPVDTKADFGWAPKARNRSPLIKKLKERKCTDRLEKCYIEYDVPGFAFKCCFGRIIDRFAASVSMQFFYSNFGSTQANST